MFFRNGVKIGDYLPTVLSIFYLPLPLPWVPEHSPATKIIIFIDLMLFCTLMFGPAELVEIVGVI